MNKLKRTAAAVALVAGVTLTSVVTSNTPADAATKWGRAPLVTAGGTSIGTVTFIDKRLSDRTLVRVTVRKASSTALQAFHGMHIHANDNATNGAGCVADATQPSNTWFVSADGHWKRDPMELHGHHAGDLPSVLLDDEGSATMEFEVDKLTPGDVIGRAVILHAGADNFANVPVGPNPDQYTAGVDALAKTQATGNAGDRFACGVVAAL
jgi:Cu-Zn family superoxide dismutase